jgi:hypothetical protein
MAERKRLSGSYVPTTTYATSRPMSRSGSPQTSHSDEHEHLNANDPSVQAADRFVAPRLDKADILQRIQMGNYTEAIDLFRCVQNPALGERANAALLSAAVKEVLEYAFTEVHPSAYPTIEALLRPLVGDGAPQPAQGRPAVSSADATSPLPTVGHDPSPVPVLSPDDGSQPPVQACGAETPPTRPIPGGSTTVNVKRALALPALHLSTMGVPLSDRYNTNVQRKLMHRLTYDRQSVVIEQAVNEALDAVLCWHRGDGEKPPLLDPDDLAGSIRLLRQQAAKRRPEMDDYQRTELTQAIDSYKADNDVVTPRDRADLAWVRHVAGKDKASPRVALDDLRVRMRLAGRTIPLSPRDENVSDEAREAIRTEAAVAQTLSTALAQASELSEAERRFLYRLIAMLVGKANKPLWAIAHPTRQPGEAHKLNPIKPYLPSHPDAAQRKRYFDGVNRAADHQRRAKDDVRHVLILLSKLDRTRRAPGGGNVFIETTPNEQCAQLLATANCSPSRVRYALYLISKGGGSKGQVAAKLLDEMRYSLREATGSNLPMTNGEIFQHFLQGLGNCFMEGGSHYAASVGVALTAYAMGPYSGLLVLGSLGLQIYSLGWLEAQKTEEYHQQPSRTAKLLLATPYLVAPAAALSGTMKLVGRIGYLPVKLPDTFGQALEFYVIIRFLRQVPQTWFRNRYFAGFQVRHADGTGLTAGEQFQLNICRDIGYLVFGGICLYFGPTLTAQVLEALGVVGEAAETEAGRIITILVTYLWGALAEWVDGGNPDWFKLLYRLVKGDAYMLQPGTQANPGLDPTHYLKNATSRGVANGLSDFFNGLKDMFIALGQPGLAELCRLLAIVWNGLAGSLRTRVADYLTTGETLADNGSKNPAGLMTALGMLAVDMGQGVAGAASGLATQVTSAFGGLGIAPVVAQPVGVNDRQAAGDGDIGLQPVVERPAPSDDDLADNDPLNDDPSGNDDDSSDGETREPTEMEKEFFDMVKNL